MTTAQYKPGDLVTWSSTSGGGTTTKQGTVIAVIPNGTNIFHVDGAAKLLQVASKAQQKFSEFESRNARYLVAVPRYSAKDGSRLPSHYYAPNVRVVDKAMALGS